MVRYIRLELWHHTKQHLFIGKEGKKLQKIIPVFLIDICQLLLSSGGQQLYLYMYHVAHEYDKFNVSDDINDGVSKYFFANCLK